MNGPEICARTVRSVGSGRFTPVSGCVGLDVLLLLHLHCPRPRTCSPLLNSWTTKLKWNDLAPDRTVKRLSFHSISPAELSFPKQVVSFPLEQKQKKKHNDKGKKNFTHFAAGSDLMRLCCKWFFFCFFFAIFLPSKRLEQQTAANPNKHKANQRERIAEVASLQLFLVLLRQFSFLLPLRFGAIYLHRTKRNKNTQTHTHTIGWSFRWRLKFIPVGDLASLGWAFQFCHSPTPIK